MSTDFEVYDVVIIGAGPAGLACALEAQKQKLSYLVIEKGCLTNSIFRFPTNLILFSTPDLLEIGGIPFIISSEKPTRTDLLKYYRRVTESAKLNIRLFEKVEAISVKKIGFIVQTNRNQNYLTKNIVVATGQYDHPNMMNIPGEELDKVSHYYTEGHPFYNKKVAVIGGKNSAVETALDLYKHDADVTIIHRGKAFGKSVKYWILPDIENRIKEGKIKALFNTSVVEIKENYLVIQDLAGGQRSTVDNDFVFALTGYHPDQSFLKSLGIQMDSQMTPTYNPDTLETNVPGIYVAGVITAGCEGSKVFIENTRDHGKKIIGHIINGTK